MKDQEALLKEVEELVAVYIGRKADGEEWSATMDRLKRLDRLAKKIRKAGSGGGAE